MSSNTMIFIASLVIIWVTPIMYALIKIWEALDNIAENLSKILAVSIIAEAASKAEKMQKEDK